MDEVLSVNEKLTLKDYLAQEKPVKYFISQDERQVFVIRDNQVSIIYSIED